MTKIAVPARSRARRRSGRACAALVFAAAVGSVPTAAALHAGERHTEPRWSPDGRSIAFTVDHSPRADIYLMNADGSGARNLTRTPSGELSPSWSPDSRRLTFTANRDGNWEIYVMNADGTGQRRLTTNAVDDFYPAWSPDGASIAFYRRNEALKRSEIWVVRADGSDERALVAQPGNSASPEWSPDGTRIAFQSNRTGNWELYVMDADGANQRRLTVTPGREEGEPSWSHDGARIVFSAGEGQARDIYVVGADGSGERRLTRLGLPVWAPRWSVDDARVAFYEYPAAVMYVVDADGTGLRKLVPREPPRIAALSFSPRVPVAGSRLTAVLSTVATHVDAVTCRAQVAGRTLRLVIRSAVERRGRCTWFVPHSAKGRRLTGNIGVRAGGTALERTFALTAR